MQKLIYHVLPTRITGKITFSNEDPAVTGMVLAVLGMTIPFHKNKIEVAPLFDDENVLEGDPVKGKDLWSCSSQNSSRALFQ